MDITQLFLERYTPLQDFYLAGIWARIPHNLMRQQPHPDVNSIAWILWHNTRVEDAGLNRFVVDRSQVLDEGSWMQSMKIPWRHLGSEMSSPEVESLSQQIDLNALHEYSLAVQERTLDIVNTLSLSDLDAVMEEEHLQQVMVGEGLAHSQPEGFIQNYLGWSKGKSLMTFGLTHSFQHLGEIEVIANLLGVRFE